jgi:uncharacterized protein YjiS (DUF1127 family)
MNNEAENKENITPTDTSTPNEQPKDKTSVEQQHETSEGEANPQAENTSSGDGNKADEENRKSQSSKENARFAQLRRENERLAKELDATKSELRGNISDTALKDLGLTREDLKDESNMALARSYMKAVANGEENPTLSAYKEQRSEALKRDNIAREQARLEANRNTAIQEDAKNFAKAFPKDNIVEITKDNTEFMRMYGQVPDLMGNVTKYYGIYKSLKGNSSSVATEAEKNYANPDVHGEQGTNKQKSYEDVVREASKDPNKLAELRRKATGHN